MPVSNIYKLSLVSMSGRSQLVIKSSEKLCRLSMSDRQGLSLEMRTIASRLWGAIAPIGFA
ncbi:MAG: hypothetical protein ACYT04_57035 [Nostoc sp.]